MTTLPPFRNLLIRHWKDPFLRGSEDQETEWAFSNSTLRASPGRRRPGASGVWRVSTAAKMSGSELSPAGAITVRCRLAWHIGRRSSWIGDADASWEAMLHAAEVLAGQDSACSGFRHSVFDAHGRQKCARFGFRIEDSDPQKIKHPPAIPRPHRYLFALSLVVADGTHTTRPIFSASISVRSWCLPTPALYLYPAVHISFSRSLFQVFFGLLVI